MPSFVFVSFFFCFLGGVASAKYSIWYHYLLESNTLYYVFLPDGVSLPCDRGWILTSSSSADDDVIIQLHQSMKNVCVPINKQRQKKRQLTGFLLDEAFDFLQIRCHVFPWLFCFCFVFVFLLSIKPRPFVQSFFDMYVCAPTATPQTVT